MKIYIRRHLDTINNEIFFVNRPNTLSKGDVIQFLNFNEKGECINTEKRHDYGMELDMKPTMILPEVETRELIQAFLDVAKEERIDNHNETYAKGKLEAMSDHLKDMRKLLKL